MMKQNNDTVVEKLLGQIRPDEHIICFLIFECYFAFNIIIFLKLLLISSTPTPKNLYKLHNV